MRLPEEHDNEPKVNMSAVYTVLGVILFVTVVMIIVLAVNYAGWSGKGPLQPFPGNTPGESQQISEQENGEREHVQSPDDLDFWDMYPVESGEEEGEKKESEEDEDDPSTDGKHTKIVYADGETEWVKINPRIEKHSYDFTKLVCQSDIMKYYVDGKQASYAGVEISEEQDYVDFGKLKKEGISFVMLRVGARRYSTGQIMEDDYFADNIKRATDAGLDIGVYFFSQAITEAEAEEEAKWVLDMVKEYELEYPIVYKMTYISNDSSRIDDLSKDEKTKIALKFLDTVEDGGYVPMMYGTKEWLIKQVNLSRFEDYDIWLSQNGDLPDYPYRFAVWQYASDGDVEGISGGANMLISFIDYSEK